MAVLRVDDPTPFLGEPVHFDASGSVGHDEGNGRIVAYRFDFGDGAETEWQASPFAEHAYTSAGSYSASLDARDRRNLEGHARIVITVRSVPPPTGEAPDLTPAAASLSPPHPKVDEVVTLAVTIMNQGGTAARSASVDVLDERPSGAKILLDTLALPGPLEPGATAVLISSSFLAVEAGNHTIRITVRDVFPAETLTEDDVLELRVEVTGPAPVDGGGGGGPSGFGLDPVVIGLVAAALASLLGAILFLMQPVETTELTPLPPEPPDRRPPPIWPP